MKLILIPPRPQPYPHSGVPMLHAWLWRHQVAVAAAPPSAVALPSRVAGFQPFIHAPRVTGGVILGVAEVGGGPRGTVACVPSGTGNGGTGPRRRQRPHAIVLHLLPWHGGGVWTKEGGSMGWCSSPTRTTMRLRGSRCSSLGGGMR